MLTEKRHEIILQLLRKKGSITVNEIKDELGISESTIRRDLNTQQRLLSQTILFILMREPLQAV